MKNLNLIIVAFGSAALTIVGTTLTASVSKPDSHVQVALPGALSQSEPQQTSNLANPQVDYPGFLRLSAEVAKYRESRKVDLDQFLTMQRQAGTIVLDTRSRANYDRKHIKGAVHLNFSELTKADLARVVPNLNTRILIYCNNNFTDNTPAFANKSPALALNIPTFVTLYGYDYRNVYELGESVSESDSRIPFGGTR